MVLLDLFNAAEQCPRGTSEDRDPRRWGGGGGGGGGGQRIFKADTVPIVSRFSLAVVRR